MQAFSAADGFLTVKEGVDEMIKYLANEPSVGLYYVQQHAQASMPHLLSVKENIEEKIHEVILHTEDIEDSICAVRSMSECGIPISDEMIKDINKSLLIISTSQPKRGLIQNPSWGFQLGAASSLIPEASDSKATSSRNYFSTIFNSAKQKATGFRWTTHIHQDTTIIPVKNYTSENIMLEGEELPLSNSLSVNQSENLSVIEDFDKFKTEQELKLQEWFQNIEDCTK